MVSYWLQYAQKLGLLGVGLMLLTTTKALANPESAETQLNGPSFSDLSGETSSSSDSPYLDPLVFEGENEVAQVNSVSQLSDIQPTDWAFQSLQSLVERYGCIAGYPNGTFRGGRSVSRYEMAASLNACLDQISDRFASKADLDAVKALQDEFAAELATMRGRVDGLEAQVATVEAQQFSTTTKLSGRAFFNLTGATAGRNVRVETVDATAPLPIRPAGRDLVTGNPLTAEVRDPNVTLSGLVWLSFNTSFTGQDSLVVQLASGNGESPANAYTSAGLFNTFGTPYTDQTAGLNAGDVVLRELFYEFPVANSLRIAVGPRVNWYRYFDNNNYTFFINGTSSFNSIDSTLTNNIDRGSGAVLMWDISDKLQLHVGYLGESNEFLPNPPFNSASNPNQGLFGGTNSLTTELTYSPTQNVNLRFLYNRVNTQAIFGTIGGAIGEPIGGIADDGFGGPLDNSTSDVFGFNFDWAITPRFGIFGRYGYGTTKINPATPGVPGGRVNVQSIQAGLAFSDLGREGARLTLSYVMPYDYLDGERFLVSGAGNGAIQHDVEATYYFPLNDNIAIVPSFYTIINANNFSDNPTIFVGNLRLQFSF
ncbi:MAG: iron uptake porin [Thermosynechococcaceae cyanobacterium]